MSLDAQNDTTRNQQGADTETDGPDAFDLAVDERLGAAATGPGDDAADDNAPGSEQQDEGKQPGSEPEARADTPAGGTTPPATEPSSDIWQNATPEQLAALEAIRAEAEAAKAARQRLIGQVSASDRELARLRREREAAPAPQTGEKDQPGNADDPFESDEVKRFTEEYGEIATPLMKLLKAQAQEIAALKGPVAEVAQTRATEARQSEIDVFAAAHPDWEQYVTDDRYPAWLAEQPKAVRDAAARAVNIEDGQEAAWLLGQFKAHVGAQAPTQQNDQNTAPRATDLKRQRQLNAGRDAGGTASPTIAGVPDDFDAAVAAATAAKEQSRERARSA